MEWQDRAFSDLSTAELYAILALRDRVFVVEQQCAYLEADGADLASRHVYATRAGELIAYLRVVPPHAGYPEPSLGRVVIAPAARGAGLGRVLVERGLASARAHHGEVVIRIAAQSHLTRFYASLGFAAVGEPFDDSGIPHVYMLRDPGSHA